MYLLRSGDFAEPLIHWAPSDNADEGREEIRAVRLKPSVQKPTDEYLGSLESFFTALGAIARLNDHIRR
jgi:hypothetical protein